MTGGESLGCSAPAPVSRLPPLPRVKVALVSPRHWYQRTRGVSAHCSAPSPAAPRRCWSQKCLHSSMNAMLGPGVTVSGQLWDQGPTSARQLGSCSAIRSAALV